MLLIQKDIFYSFIILTRSVILDAIVDVILDVILDAMVVLAVVNIGAVTSKLSREGL